jgi:predicted RNA binding protein YcfA (HicA-like mRNA interferase family)
MSPRLPRDVSGAALAKRLEAFGYAVTRQKGSHLRLTTQQGGEHHVTVPNHGFLRTGTLNGVLKEVAEHVAMTRDEVVDKKDRSANGTSASDGRAGRITRSNSRNRSVWMRPDGGGAEVLPVHAQGRICLVGADRP